MSDGHPASNRNAVVRGREHFLRGNYVVESLGASLAVGMTPGAGNRPWVDPNEDAGAIVQGPRAALLVVADAHFGHEASEVAVEHVLEALGHDPPPADLSEEELVSIFFEAGMAVQRATSRAGFVHPDTRTTLALALVADDAMQWASLGDSCVAVAGQGGAALLNEPRSAYLGYRFSFADVAAVTDRGRTARNGISCLVLATDGLLDVLCADGLSIEDVISAGECAHDATLLTEALLQRAVQGRAGDAVTIAVAAMRRSGQKRWRDSP